MVTLISTYPAPYEHSQFSLGMSEDYVSAVRFSTDLKKLAVLSWTGSCLEVWDVQSQKLDVRIGGFGIPTFTYVPVFWTNDNKNILAAFSFTKDDPAKTVYEFDASTLETVGSPFQGHTNYVTGLALSFRGALLASASIDNTIKLWDCESRQLLGSFDVQNIRALVLSPNSRQLAYVINNEDEHDYNICICDTPTEVLAQARTSARKKAALHDLLNSDATRPAAGRRRPPISVTPTVAPRPLPTVELQQPIFLRLSNFLRFSPRTNAVRPGRKDQSRDPLDFPATLPLPSNRIHGESAPSASLPRRSAFVNPTRSSSGKGKQKAREPKRKPVKVVNVPLGQATYADAVGVDDGYRPYVVFFCLSWFQKKKKKPEPQPVVYDDEFDGDDDEEDENVPVPVTTPPRVQHEEFELKPMASQSQPEAGPSCLAVTNNVEDQSS
ncbi:tricorn protease domain 2-containing protein [Suillus brevipes Sb2]|nr:tricorn protease domain 2-containing protein [Suillus brevipes Sb2]